MDINTLIGIIANPLGVLSFLMGFYFYYKARMITRVSYSVHCQELLGEKKNSLPGEISILFNGSEIRSLYRITIRVWNSGTTTITKHAVIQSDKPVILIPTVRSVLKATIAKTSVEHNKFSMTPDENMAATIFLDFDYFERHQGVKIELLTEDDPGDASNVRVSGTVQGMPGGFVRTNPAAKEDGIGCLVLVIVGCIFAIFVFLARYLNDAISKENWAWISLLLSVAAPIIVIISVRVPRLSIMRRHFPPLHLK
ncbi:hypothetical protein LPC08_06800 [Roseomonas sp. OT10]|uniref:hypothetical protein n=1 Tax=Roseomonas cutis TaxID=2897332 RepID=UPI001E4BF820|nr:hypothetical protein [Roseomonas sp. OT10]UFN50327.1 hypothetical protein LPC08_06800 [Roseomonas sp. OT10]